MRIITAKYIFIDNEYKENMAIAFNRKIGRIDKLDILKKDFNDAQIIEFQGEVVIYPGFINLHTHLEFSANKATLKLGDFIKWLYSVIENREELIKELDNNIIEFAINEMLKSGVTTFGAISSFGADLKACAEAKQRVIFFNEVIGSNPAMVDALFSDFKIRLQESMEYKSQKFYPAVAIHSPYAVHPFLIREVLNIAKKENLLISTHFLESPYEREWLESGKGAFREFFQRFFNTSTPVTTIQEFLNHFKNIKTLFTHCTQATKDELEFINNHNHSIIHCPRSNRLLNCGVLDIKEVKNLLLATDGLSSNYSLSILDELKAALFLHSNIEPNSLALNLINSITTNAANALELKVGKIQKGYFADFAILRVPDDLKDKEDIPLHSIINSKVEAVFIDGQRVI
ncbi:MAG: metal-dependent hydrolase [Epsilonproteobacteria bacterium]|nr:metal-dependent hydrolase [Campylobacterota bacterium]